MVFALALGLAQAQLCLSELQNGLAAEELAQMATGFEAAQYLKQAVDLLEPALPANSSLPEWFKLEPGSADYELASWLAERDLLAEAWQADTLSPEVWQEMLGRFQSWYELSGVAGESDLSRAGLIDALSKIISAVAPNLKPVALVASSSANRNQVAFWAVIRNDSIYPRLIVYRPAETPVDLSEGTKSALPLLETCAMKLSNYIFAREDVARNLFLSNHNGQMYMVASSPISLSGYKEIASGSEADVLTFRSPETEGLSSYAAVFAGNRVGPTTIARLLPRVRTNMNPKQVIDFVLGL